MNIIKEEEYGYLITNDEGQVLLEVATRDVDMPGSTGYEVATKCELVSINTTTTDEPILIEAMRLIIQEVENDYDDTLYIPSGLNDEEKVILNLLFEKGYLTKKSLLDPDNEDYQHSFFSKGTLTNLTTASAKQKVPGNTRGGFMPKNAKIEKRKPRSYKKENMPQLLRHIATQMYNYAKNLKLDPVEVQLMFFNSSLFIATNDATVTKQLFLEMNSLDDLKKVLVTEYRKRSKLESQLSKRFATKINSRIYNKHEFNDVRANFLKEILSDSTKFKTCEIDMLNIDIEKINNNIAIYFITKTKKSGLHAEIELLNLFHTLNDSREAIIYGKKRPCFTCHSELEHYNTDADFKFIDFNPRKGFFFSEELKKQKPSTLEATTASLAYTGTIYETDPVAGYCTLSDSELESDEEEVLVKDLKKKAMIS